MKFNIIPTDKIYHRLLNEPDAAVRESMYRSEFVQPYEGLIQMFGGGDGVAMFKQWSMYGPDDFADGKRVQIVALLQAMEAAGAWEQTVEALEDARKAVAPFADRIPLETIEFGLFLSDKNATFSPNPDAPAYTGFGGIPGWIMVVYGEATEYTLQRIKGCTVHELHHNLLGAAFPNRPMIASVGDYMIGEGLAESFAAELYGEDALGFYVTDFSDEELARAKRVIGGALNVSGFDNVRRYIFGDSIVREGAQPAEQLPNYAGYGIGYRVVQAYMQRTGKSVAEATFVPARDIIAESGFFE
jgi:uncharacterized protein YjaZ